MKTVRIFLLAFIATLCSVSSWGQQYDYDFEVDGIYYKISSLEKLEVEVVKGEKAYSGDIVLPATVEFKNRKMNVLYISNDAFKYCQNLVSIDLGRVKEIRNGSISSQNRIKYGAFLGCEGLASVICDSLEYIGAAAFYECPGIKSLDLKNVKTIGEASFCGCTGLSSIKLDSLQYIHDSAFSGCTGLTSLSLQNIQYFGVCAFQGCKGLTSVSFGNTSKIGDGAFWGCGSLASIDFGNVETIGEASFSGCIGLTSLNLGKVKTIQRRAFVNCKGLSSIDFGDVLHIEEEAFRYCEGLSSLDFKNVYNIKDLAFSDCPGIKSIDLKNLKWMNSRVFKDCAELESIKTSEKEPPSFGYDSFHKYAYLATLYVPQGSKSAYQNDSDWKNFATIVEVGSENKVSLNVECNDGGRVDFGEFTVASGKVTEVFDKGEKVTLKFLTAKGFKLKSVYVGGEDVTAKLVNNSYEVTLNETTDVVATFEMLPFTLTLQQADNGNIKLDVVESQSYTLQINPAEGWKINTVTFNGVDVTSELDAYNYFKTPGILENSVLNVSFELIESTAVATVDLNNISVTGYDNAIYVSGAKRGDLISVYTVEGSLVTKVQSTGEAIKMDVPESKVYFVKIGERTFKLSL